MFPAKQRSFIDCRKRTGLFWPALQHRHESSGKCLSVPCAQHVPNPRTFRGGLIAATALVHGMTVVTRNLATETEALDRTFEISKNKTSMSYLCEKLWQK
jgi:hypothetical protein